MAILSDEPDAAVYAAAILGARGRCVISAATLVELVANNMGVTLLPEMALRRETAASKKLKTQKSPANPAADWSK